MEIKIKELAESGESQNLEFKSKLGQSLGKSICSFANTNDGIILIGVSDTGEIIGTKEKDEQKIANIAHTCKPSVYPKIEKVKINGKIVLPVEIRKSDQIHSFKNVAYKRVGTYDKPLSPEEVIEFAKSTGEIRWDEQICKGATIEDIDTERVKWFLQTAKAKRNYTLDEDTPLSDALTHLDLSCDGKLTNAAILLFGKNPQKFFIQSELKCLHFHGTEVEKPFETYHVYRDSAFQQVDNALDFVLTKLKRPVIPEEGKPTTKRPYEIPEFVVREALVNATAHRDYYSTASVQVMVFADRIEIWNPGELPSQLTLDELKKPHPSIPLNPSIAEALYLARYIEKAGSGTIEMVKQCRENNLPEPEFEQKMGSFVVTIWRDIYTDTYLNRFELNERQREAVKYVKENGSISNSEYCNLSGVSRKTATTDLTDLVSKNIFSTVGTGKRVLRYELRLRKNYAKITQKKKGKVPIKAPKEE
jgi:predicted HTH transcriptional regulator